MLLILGVCLNQRNDDADDDADVSVSHVHVQCRNTHTHTHRWRAQALSINAAWFHSYDVTVVKYVQTVIVCC